MNMKKLALLSTILVGVVLLAGCKKDPIAPKLTLMTGEGYLCEGAETMVGEPFKVGLQCEADKLSALNIIFMKGEAFATEDTEYWENASTATYERTFIIMYDGDITMTAKLFDTNGQTSTITVHFKSVAPPEPEPEPEPEPDPEPTSFDGIYDGFTKIEGSVSALGVNYPVNDSTQVEMTITELEDGQVTAVYIYKETSYDLTGSIQDDQIVFDPFPLEIAETDFQLSATINLKGTLDENVLSLEGSLTDCTLNYGGMQIPVLFDGGISGVLTKIE